MNQNPQKSVYVVLGMPRSGTSATARALESLGIYLGNQLIPGNAAWNAKGYFEDKDIVDAINKKILNTLFDRWESVKLLDREQLLQPALASIRAKAIKLIHQRYGSAPQWGFKDPRTVRVLPFWQSIFTELQLEDRYVIALRNPLASAHSFSKLTKIDFEKALLLWVAHLIPAVDETIGKKRIVVSYDLLLQDPLSQLNRIQHFFNIAGVNADDMKKYANEFLDKKLTHYQFSENDFKNHPTTSWLIPFGYKIYDLLLQLAQDKMTFDQPEFLTAWASIKQEFAQSYPMYCYMDGLMKQNKVFERQLRRINKSLTWKMSYPLRIIHDKLRLIKNFINR